MEEVKGLAFATPESKGIPPGAIIELLDFLEEKDVCLHSFMLLRHGAVVAEGYWPPFYKDSLQRIYSISKSITSVAIGLMINEGRLKLDDTIASFFPEALPTNPHPFLLQATVRDLLMMATFNPRSAPGAQPGSPSGVWRFFNLGEPLHPPGALFLYDTAGTNTLGAIIEKLSGMSIVDYMRPNLLDPIGFSKEAFCMQFADGRSFNGAGMLCTTRDLARFALLCMNYGAYEGKQLISKAYMQAATSRQIENGVARSEPKLMHGYGYQFWRLPDDGFACYGLGGQFIFCMPAFDAVFVTTADVQLDDGLSYILDAFTTLLKRIGNKQADDVAAHNKLSARLASLSFKLPEGKLSSTAVARYNGVVFNMKDNPMKLSTIKLDFKKDEVVFSYVKDTNNYSIRIGLGQYIRQKFPEPYHGRIQGVRDRYYETLAVGAWIDENVFKCTVKAVDWYVGTIRMQFVFRGNSLTVQMAKAVEVIFDNYQGVAWGDF